MQLIMMPSLRLLDFIFLVYCCVQSDVVKSPMENQAARIRHVPRENIFSPMAFVKSPSTTKPNVAMGSRRATGDASPLWLFGDEQRPTSRKNVGSLYLFGAEGPEMATAATPRTITRHYGNTESTSQREFPSSGIRRVDPCIGTERHCGVRIVTTTRNHEQNIDVVGLSSPATEQRVRGIRCGGYTENRNAVVTIEKVLDRNLEIGSEADAAFIEKRGDGKPIKPDHSVNSVERFVMAVADHVQHRSNGVSSFYVALSRGLVAPGNVAVPIAPPSPKPDLWYEPPKRRLSLAQCHNQLVGLTGISDVSVRDLAAVFWDMDGMDAVPDATIESLDVSFADFSGVFAVAPKTKKLSSHKI
jgi:hypothetical protein